MTQTDPKNEEMKQALKEALTETLHEQRELLHEVFAEVLEDFALPKRSGKVARPSVSSVMRFSTFWKVGR